jgi:hypothetical protein
MKAILRPLRQLPLGLENHNDQPWVGSRACGRAAQECPIRYATPPTWRPCRRCRTASSLTRCISGKIDQRGPQPKRPSLANNTAELHVAEFRRIFPLNGNTRHRVAKGHQALHTCLHFLATSSWFPATLRSERLSGNQTNGCNYRNRFHVWPSRKHTGLAWPTVGAAPAIVTTATATIEIS